MTPLAQKKRIGIVGAGPAGLSAACFAAERGHEIHLFDKATEIGGQFNYAKQIPGKEEFHETIRYFKNRLADAGVNLHLGQQQTADSLQQFGFDDVVIATGVVPRDLDIEGADLPHVLGYLDVLRDHKPVGTRVAIIGAGGIGFDVAEFLSTTVSPTLDTDQWHAIWGIDKEYKQRGALLAEPLAEPNPRKITLMQRKASKVGGGLGKTSGWVHRNTLRHKGVKMLAGVTYERVVPEGLEVTIDGQRQLIEADAVIVCAGQLPLRELEAPLAELGVRVHRIGGADVAAELDAKRAIRQGAELAATL